MNILHMIHILFLLLLQNAVGDAIQVTVEQGTLDGERVDLITNNGFYYSFKGIPYAQPPIGPLRFKAPMPALSWDGVRNATQHGAICPQVDILTNTYYPGNEDCLFLNVYSPDITLNSSLFPVVVFIHGGGYKSGSGNVDSYGPDFLVNKKVVVVTINYRLDALGFMTLDTEDVPGNAGLKDQVMALKWIQSNIKQFGGDPDKVTIMGQSAGAACVGFHIISPMSQGLFHRAIAMSGSPYSEWSLGFENQRRALVLAEQLLGFNTKDLNVLLGSLQNVSAPSFVNATARVLSSEEYTTNVLKLYNFVPGIEKYSGENNFISYDYFKNISHVNKVDILFGFTNLEAVSAVNIITNTGILQNYDTYRELFVPYKTLQRLEPLKYLELADTIINNYFGNKSIDTNSMREFVNYASFLVFAYDVVEFYSRIPIIEDNIRYLYQFSSSSNRNVYSQLGQQYNITNVAGHLDDTSYLFDPKSFNMTLDTNSLEFQLIDQVTTLFTNFIIHGNPTPDSSLNVTWPPFDNTSKKYLEIGNNLSVSQLNDHVEYNYWEQFYRSIGIYV